MFPAQTALAAAQRTFVASGGSDTTACSLSTPCRSFATAIAQTLSGGEVIVLDSAGYGPVIITKPVSIIAPSGVYAGISAFSGTGIVVNPGSGYVTLRGLTLNGLGGTRGIDYQSGTMLLIENVTISGFSGDGIHGTLVGAGKVVIRDTVSRRNGNGALFSTTSGLVTVVVEHSRFEGNSSGLYLGDRVQGYAQDSMFDDNVYGAVVQSVANSASSRGAFAKCAFTRNTSAGVLVGLNTFATSVATITDSSVTGNAVGIVSQSGGGALVSNTTISTNATGVSVNDPISGGISTYLDNRMTANTSDGTFSGTISRK